MQDFDTNYRQGKCAPSKFVSIEDMVQDFDIKLRNGYMVAESTTSVCITP